MDSRQWLAERGYFDRLREEVRRGQVECPGGMTDPIYHGLATGLCPSCGEFVALVNTGQTVRHFCDGVA